jgi:hypothetical protein
MAKPSTSNKVDHGVDANDNYEYEEEFIKKV